MTAGRLLSYSFEKRREQRRHRERNGRPERDEQPEPRETGTRRWRVDSLVPDRWHFVRRSDSPIETLTGGTGIPVADVSGFDIPNIVRAGIRNPDTAVRKHRVRAVFGTVDGRRVCHVSQNLDVAHSDGLFSRGRS